MIDEDKLAEFIAEHMDDIIKGHEDELLDKLNIQVSPTYLPDGLIINYLKYKDGTIR